MKLAGQRKKQLACCGQDGNRGSEKDRHWTSVVQMSVRDSGQHVMLSLEMYTTATAEVAQGLYLLHKTSRGAPSCLLHAAAVLQPAVTLHNLGQTPKKSSFSSRTCLAEGSPPS